MGARISFRERTALPSREAFWKKNIYEETASLRPFWLLAAVLMGAVFSASVFAQNQRKDSNTRPIVTVSAADQTAFGKDLFRQHCASCHFAETTVQKIGPGLKGMYARPFSDGKKVTDAGITKWIEAGGKDMPGFKETVTPEQIRALISYIKTL